MVERSEPEDFGWRSLRSSPATLGSGTVNNVALVYFPVDFE
jgi:hypothetical protein